MALIKISRSALEEVEHALVEYEVLLEQRKAQGGLTRSTRNTYFSHASDFVRWLKGEFDPGSQKLR